MKFRLGLKLTLLTAVLGGAGLFYGSAVEAADKDSAASLGSGNPVSVTIPEILIQADVDLYQGIFAVQESGDWKTADSLIGRLGDRLLMGHVMAQRYLHPTKYRSRYKELKAWMAKYADHPDAPRLYKLAKRRQPRNWRSPKVPQRVPAVARAEANAGVAIPGKRLGRADRRKVRQFKRRIRSLLRRGYTLAVKKLIGSKELKRLFSTAEYDEAKARLGRGYFAAGRDGWALKWAGEAAMRSGRYMQDAHWTAGLAAWRLKKFDIAGGYFEAVADFRGGTTWLTSAGAFWAARAYLVDRQPEKVNALLQAAASHARTFYGILAGHMLGREMVFRWISPPLGQETVRVLSAAPRGRRAMALLQVGENHRAQRELRNLAAGADDKLAKGILGLAGRSNMPSLAVKLDKRLYPNGGGYDGAAYPLPGWMPEGGFRIDQALIYALIRQESHFNPKAKSPAGARGLMQLMPRTASFVARDRGYHRHSNTRRKLFKPEINLALGQKYIEILLADKKIKGDLFLMAAAWNGGPGNLNKWRRKTDYMDDALFFIESIPSRETRNFIEKVLSNLWAYRHRLGQSTPSLDAIAEGRWPVYTPQGQDTAEVAGNGTRQ